MSSNAIIKNYLMSLGTRIQTFSQNKGLLNDAISEEVRIEFQPGYCRGASLDWLRRVLGRAAQISPTDRIADEAYEQRLNQIHSLPGGHDKESRVLRMTTVQKEIKTFERDYSKYMTKLTLRYHDDYKQALTRYGATFVEENDKLIVIACPPDKLEPLRAELDSIKKAFERGAHHQDAFLKQTSVNSITYGAFERADRLDQKFGRKRKFGDLTILAARGLAHSQYKDSISFTCECFNIKVLEPGTGMVLNYSLDRKAEDATAWNRGAGHSIAIHYQDPGTWAVFDPNLGVFGFKSRDKATKFVAALFDLLYRNDTMRPSVLLPGGECTVFADRSYTSPGMSATSDSDRETAVSSGEQAKSARKAYKQDREMLVRKLRDEAEAEIHLAEILYLGTHEQIRQNKKPDPNTYIRQHNKAVRAWNDARDVGEDGMSIQDAKRVWDKFNCKTLMTVVGYWD